jgi:protease I
MAKVVMMVPNKYQHKEYKTVLSVLKSAGHKVVRVSAKKGELASSDGEHKITVKKTFADVKTLSAIVVIGGSGAKKLYKNEEACDLIRLAHKQDAMICAICLGVGVLASAGVILGISVTCWKDIESQISEAGGIYHDEPVVVDGMTITGQGPKASLKFARTLAEALGG